jgi:hypothetical protein
VYKKAVAVRVLVTQATRVVEKQTHTFRTMTAHLLALDEWLRGQYVEHIAMESTGAYWRLVWNILNEGDLILLTNSQSQRDARMQNGCEGLRMVGSPRSAWTAQSQFIPLRPMSVLWRLTRYRKTLVQERAHEVNRLQKVLERANIRLTIEWWQPLYASYAGRGELDDLSAFSHRIARRRSKQKAIVALSRHLSLSSFIIFCVTRSRMGIWEPITLTDVALLVSSATHLAFEATEFCCRAHPKGDSQTSSPNRGGGIFRRNFSFHVSA